MWGWVWGYKYPKIKFTDKSIGYCELWQTLGTPSFVCKSIKFNRLRYFPVNGHFDNGLESRGKSNLKVTS
jgi:hypothetical protein